MSELTPEQWRELDEARRLHREHQARPEAMDGYGAWSNLAGALVRHHDALIDAARPKCQRCNGTGNLQRVTPADGDFVIDCTDCIGHPGWAA